MRGLLRIVCWCVVAASLAAQPAPSDRVKAMIAQGAKLEEAGRLDEAARAYVAARDQAERNGDRKSAAQASTSLGFVRYYRGEMNQALVDLRRAHDTYRAINDVQGQRSVLEHIAHIYADSRVGQSDRAIEYYRQLLAEYEAAREAENVADTLFNLGSTYMQKGDQEHALEWFARALEAEKRLGRRGEVATVQRSMAVALGNMGRFTEALPLLDDALRVFVDMKDAEGAMQVRQSRGIVLRKLGRLGAAIDDLEATRDWYASNRNTRFLEKSQDELALAYASARRWDDAYRARTEHAALERELAVKRRDEHTARLRVQFDSEKTEQENRALLRQNAAAARIRRLQTMILILGAVAIAILAYLALRLRRMAMTDELTRLPNRRHVLAVAERELQHARTTGETFCLLAIDVDEFKSINDRWGHAAGDLVLQRVAHTCRTILGRPNVIGRTGGEEFLAVLPRTSLAPARTLAERLRAAVERIDVTDIDPALRVTLSMGLIEWTPSDGTLASISRRADELLYRAKQGGRNRVEVAA